MRFLVAIFLFALSYSVYAQENESTAIGQINNFMDQWHKDAANADFDGYFGAMHDEGRFLGTDKTERWSKQQFMDYAKGAFEKKKTWDFTPKDRLVFLSSDMNLAWFDEVLDTWMGPCRGSAVEKEPMTAGKSCNTTWLF